MTVDTETQQSSEPQPQRRSIGAQRNPNSEKAILDAAEEILREDGYRRLFHREGRQEGPRRQADCLPLVAE